MFNILLVDDEPIVKIALRTMIDWDSLGFPICGTASDGVEALALVKELNPDIIITDLKMPNMDGLELIRQLNEIGYKGKVIVASNFGEYELVREALLLGAVDYMLKISIKTEGLIEQLQKTAKLLQEQRLTFQEQATREQVLRSNLKSVKNARLKDYFTNSYYNLEHLVHTEGIQLHLSSRPCYLFYINLNVDAAKEYDKSNMSLSFLENMILDMIESEQDAEIFQVEVNTIIVMIANEQLHHCGFEPLSFVHRIQKLIQMYMTIEPVVVYSENITGYVEARQTYQACKDAININFYETRSVIFNKDVKLKQEIDFVNYVDFSKTLLQHIYSDDKALMSSLLKALAEQCRESSIHPLAFKTFINKCLDYIPLCSNKITLSNAEQYKGNKNKVSECQSSDALLSIAIEALDSLLLTPEALASSDHVIVKKEIAEVINFIELHYQDKITLELIAEHVNFSENYLCRVFKEQTGTSLIHYINNVRMNKAAELILQGRTYIKEVSSLVGISDQFYFSRVFKKYFGVAPTDYRAHVMQSGRENQQAAH